jgi:signal transduction histidine kinase
MSTLRSKLTGIRQRLIPRHGLGIQLLALYLLFVLPVIFAALAFDQLAGERLETDVREADLALARAIARETAAVLNDAIHTVEQLAQSPAVRQAEIDGMLSQFADIAAARPDVNLIYRLGPDGEMLFHFPTGPGSTVGVNFSHRGYFQDARRLDHAVVSRGRISPTTEQAVATTVMPIRSGSAFNGVVATNIRLESLSETLATIANGYRPDQGFRVSIVDATAQVIADPNRENLLTNSMDELPRVASQVLLGQEGNLILTDGDNVEWLISYVPIPEANWGVIVRRPTAVAFASTRAFHRGLLVAIAVFLGGGVLFWIALTNRVIRPLERLAAYSQALGRSFEQTSEEPSPLAKDTERPDQVGHLSRSIMRMEGSINKRLTELSTLLDTSRAVVSTLNRDAVLDRILEQTSRLVGADTCAIIALDRSLNQFRVQASLGLSDHYIQRLRIEPSEPNSPSMRALRTKQPIQVSDTDTDASFDKFRKRAREEGYRALLAVPLLTVHAPSAVLLVYYRHPHDFTEREISLISNFANHATMAIENAALFALSDEQLQEQTRRLEALTQSMTDGLILEDLNGRVLYCNRQVLQWADLNQEKAAEFSADELRQRLIDCAQDCESLQAELDQALMSNGSVSVEWTKPLQGRALTLRLQSFNVTDSNGVVIGRGQIIKDITRDYELSRMKTSLIATVSHELRTPLAAIKGYTSTLLADDVKWDATAQEEFLSVISDETDRLNELVTNLLDLSRIEGGSLQLQKSLCHIEDLIQQAASRSRPRPKSLNIEAQSTIPPVYIDMRQIEVVIRNLLENSAKYAGPECNVVVGIERNNGRLEVRFRDDGPGVPTQYFSRIFEPFFRVEEGLVRNSSGAGLGLSICRGFIQAHGGEIWMEESPGGACIVFTLPIQETVDDE